MLDKKFFIMPIAGLLSGIAAATFFIEDNPLIITVLFGGPGLVFGLFIALGLYISNQIQRRWGIPLFALISAAGYFASVWGVVLLNRLFSDTSTEFFVAGALGAAIMLLGLKIMSSYKWVNFLILSLLAGLIAWATIDFSYYLLRHHIFGAGVFGISDFYADDFDVPGLFMLHILWNTIMSTFIGIFTNKRKESHV